MLITDKIPSATLLTLDNKLASKSTNYGDCVLELHNQTAVHFQLTSQADLITGIRLRFGTYDRENHCHVTIKIADTLHVFNARAFKNNDFTDLHFDTPQTCTPEQALNIQIFSEDASENHYVALWTSKALPLFINHLDFNSIHFPYFTRPRVSIVIPIFNKALYTYNCLLTVRDCDIDVPKEVIIVNNASTDESAALLTQLLGGVTVIRNAENTGFVQACRRGAEMASGEFILFLNNDTQVTEGWLSNLLKIMDKDSSVGITGSKLIYPNGKLQEAGGIIFNDASGWNYGRMQDPTDPRFNENRPVDYCSGASLMIRKDLWQKMGGFDLRYAPAYYEDTDLCFATRQAGYQVMYCADSQVIHHEGITAGTDTSSGYKAFQTINHKKFQAKWASVLKTHYPPPPACTPEKAALRLTIDENKKDFQVPKKKIIATHFLAQGWAPNFWNYLNIKKIDEELHFIQSIGFNTVILLVPWAGFQTKTKPITYYEEYFTLFKQLLDKLQAHDLQVILRLGYAHDNGPDSEPDGFLRQVVIGADSTILTAWCDYLDRIWTIVQAYSNVLGGFITWEDFFFMDLTHSPLEQRLVFAERTGYQDYLKTHYSIEDISTHYKQSFLAHKEIPIPAFKSSAIHLFSEFWDNLLINIIFKESKKHFPSLSMEVRIDCDPQEDSYIYHDSTFNLTSDADVSMIYYTPAWGSPNNGNVESAENILKRMQWMFDYLRTKTTNMIFIDQFNFIDNTPGFEHNTYISPEQLPHFLRDVADILKNNTIGYGLWTVRDVRANVLKNGLFEREYPCWEIDKGKIIFDETTEKKAVLLQSNGKLSQLLTWCAGAPYIKDAFFQLDFNMKKADDSQGKIILKISVLYKNKVKYDTTISPEINSDWQAIHLEKIPFNLAYELRLENKSTSVLLSDFYLYQLCQENGIIDVNGKPKSFYNDLILLNNKLNSMVD